ncbi:hypothetical protein ACRAKI_29460 [Saccharothrix isguenensis]
MRSPLPAAVAVLSAVPGVASASTGPHPAGLNSTGSNSTGLHSCGTSVEGNPARGWCEGRGRFRLVAACEDGSTVGSSWSHISGGRGTVRVHCPSSRAASAQLEPAPDQQSPIGPA